jgi:hypothetical protein
MVGPGPATSDGDGIVESVPDRRAVSEKRLRAMLTPNCGVLVAALFLTCAVANAPNLYRVTELVPGVSTKDDAIAKLGPPTATLNGENQTILQWGGPQSPVHLAISFGMDTRMIQVVTDAQKLDQLSGGRP